MGVGVGLEITVGVGVGLSGGLGVGVGAGWVGVGVGISPDITACCTGVAVADGVAVFPLPAAALTMEKKRMSAMSVPHPSVIFIRRVLVLYHCTIPRLLLLGVRGALLGVANC